MSRYRVELVLGGLLLLALAAHWPLRHDPARGRGFLPLSNMAISRAAESYAVSGVFANGRTLQLPPAGAVPREQPAPADPQRGEKLYATYCAVCHGAGGLGDGTVTRFGVPAPMSLLAEAARQRSDADTDTIIALGRKTMPAYGTELPAPDRAAVIAHIRRLQEQAQ